MTDYEYKCDGCKYLDLIWNTINDSDILVNMDVGYVRSNTIIDVDMIKYISGIDTYNTFYNLSFSCFIWIVVDVVYTFKMFSMTIYKSIMFAQHKFMG